MTSKTTIADAVRRCAAKGMSFTTTADHLGTTRGAIANIARRNDIQFGAKPRAPKPKIQCAPPPAVKYVAMRKLPAAMAKPMSRCSWHGCTCAAVEDDMFCFSHGRKGLMG